jgi:hypothetical protein
MFKVFFIYLHNYNKHDNYMYHQNTSGGLLNLFCMYCGTSQEQKDLPVFTLIILSIIFPLLVKVWISVSLE